MAYNFLKVENTHQIEAFHELPFRIYKDFPNWAPPFRFEIENIFDPDHNDFFSKGVFSLKMGNRWLHVLPS